VAVGGPAIAAKRASPGQPLKAEVSASAHRLEQHARQAEKFGRVKRLVDAAKLRHWAAELGEEAHNHSFARKQLRRELADLGDAATQGYVWGHDLLLHDADHETLVSAGEVLALLGYYYERAEGFAQAFQYGRQLAPKHRLRLAETLEVRAELAHRVGEDLLAENTREEAREIRAKLPPEAFSPIQDGPN
jgi:hypothetical protein